MIIHFVGFRDSHRFHQAMKVFGKPHFIHPRPDIWMWGDIDIDNDVVVISDDYKTMKLNKDANPDFM